MTFAAPMALLFLPFALALVAWLHARRRREVRVPTLLLWRSLPQAATARAARRKVPWRDPSLWLQFALLTALLLALAGPAGQTAGGVDRLIVLLDTTAYMRLTDVAPSRFSRAVAQLSDGAMGGPWRGGVSVVAVADRARIVATGWPTDDALVNLLTSLEPGGSAPDWLGAAERAAALAGGGSSRVLLVTSAGEVPAALAALKGVGLPSAAVERLTYGGEFLNVGVGELSVSPRGASGTGWTVSGRVASSGFARGDVVRLTAGFRPDGTASFLPWGAVDAVLEADGTAGYSLALDVPGPGEVAVRGPGGDHFADDDAAYGVLRAAAGVRVGLLGAPEPGLVRALAAAGGVELVQVQPGAAPGALDLLIVTEPLPAPPAAATVWLGAASARFAAGEPATGAELRLTALAHPLASDLDPAAVRATSAQPLLVPDGARPFLELDGAAVAWSRVTGAGRQVVVGLSTHTSDWASQLSYPAFIAALVEQARPAAGAGCRVGARCAWPGGAVHADLAVTDGAGKALPLLAGAKGGPLADAVWDEELYEAGFVPPAPGLYRVTAGDRVWHVPVTGPALGPQGGAAETAVTAAASARPLWRWLAGLALLLLLSEWIARRRRAPGGSWLPTPKEAGWLLACAAPVVLAMAGVRAPQLTNDETIVLVGGGAADAKPAWATVRVARLHATPDAPVATDLTVALEAALAAPAGGHRRVVLAGGPANLPTAEAVSLQQRFTASGTTLDLLASANEQPAALRASVAAGVRAGGAFVIEAEVTTEPGVLWSLVGRLREGQAEPAHGGQLTPSGEARASGSGAGPAALELMAGEPGRLDYLLELRNDATGALLAAREVAVDVGPRHRVLLVSTLPRSEPPLVVAALAAHGIEVVTTEPYAMPRTAEALAEYDVVALSDVPAHALFTEYQANLERFVRELGGGLIILGGPHAFGAGGYHTTPLDDLSPLAARITDDSPEVALALVLDRSGSMSAAVGGVSRMDVAKAASLEAIKLLSEHSLAAIVAFDTEAQVALPLTPTHAQEAFERALTRITPGGGTAIFPGLEAALELMSASDAAKKHVVVVTDGLSQSAEFGPVLAALNDLGISPSFVGVGSAADRRQLSTLAGMGGGALHMVTDFRALPALIAQEALMLSAEPVAVGDIATRWVEGASSAYLVDVGAITAPRLGGFIRTTSKDEAQVDLETTTSSEPVLASWRYGLGRVVAFTSDGGGTWSRDFVTDPDYGRIWGQITRWAAERPFRGAALEVGGTRGVVDVVAGLDVSDAPAVAYLLNAEGGRLGVKALEPSGPGRAAARFELAPDYAGLVEVRVQPLGAQVEAGAPAGAALSRSLRLPFEAASASRHDLSAIADLSAATGGRTLTRVARAGGLAVAWRETPALGLGLALLLVLAELALRYGAKARLGRGAVSGRSRA